jgi:nucleoporin POM152
MHYVAEIDLTLVSVEDANGCKRSLSVPGISVNVRRVKPTAKFYAKDSKYEVTVLQGETAHLPLRLTGDGVSCYYFYRR